MDVNQGRRRLLSALAIGLGGLALSERVPGMTLLTSQVAALHRPAPDYLDALAVQPKAVYSLKKLISTASAAIRVRRSSDNAEQDIGFTRNELDVTALLSFAGTGSAYVTTWYDQTGGGKHATQATAAAQPRIVNAGVFDRHLVWNGTSSWMKIAGLANGTPTLGLYTRVKQSTTGSSSSKIVVEASTNFNTAAQAFLLFTGTTSSTGVWSANASNAAGAQRANQFDLFSIDQVSLISVLWNRGLTGAGEIALFAEGKAQSPSFTPATVEQTGNFGAFDLFIGARGGSSLFADMWMDTLVLYAADTAALRQSIEPIIGYGDYFWGARANAPTYVNKIGSTYFLVDCWHARVLYTDDPYKPLTKWSILDNTLRGPHSIATDGYLYVVDSTEGEAVCSYKADGFGGFIRLQTVTVANVNQERPHRVQYDAGTGAFYVINGGDPFSAKTREMVKLTRSGDVLTVANTSQLLFLNQGYSRGFRFYDGKMYIIAEPGKVFEVAFDSTPTYTLLNTYNTPPGFESPNDIFRDSTGKWYLTATNQAICRFDSLADMHAGNVEDVYSLFGFGGTPYFLAEFDGFLWIPEIIQRNGVVRIRKDVPTLVHNYGPENASDLARHTAAV